MATVGAVAISVVRGPVRMGSPGYVPVGPRPDGTIAVACWCQQKIVMVPLYEMRAGRTRSCGQPGCDEPEAA